MGVDIEMNIFLDYGFGQVVNLYFIFGVYIKIEVFIYGSKGSIYWYICWYEFIYFSVLLLE